MSSFCKYRATGFWYDYDKKGKIERIRSQLTVTGVARDDKFLTGSVYRQNVGLLTCNALELHTYPI